MFWRARLRCRGHSLQGLPTVAAGQPTKFETTLSAPIAELMTRSAIGPLLALGPISGAYNIYRIIGSLLFAIASITFFAGRVEDTKSQQLVLNGCILGFAVMFITLGTMTVTQVANITVGTTVFAILTALCLYTRVKTKSD